MTEARRGSVTIVDYGVGNLGSVGRAFKRLAVPHELTADPGRIARSRALVLPGVGHFGESMSNLRKRELEAPIKEALANGARLLGICVGFQMLFETSEEAPGVPGLGLLSGRVARFSDELVVPHIGWNQLESLGSAGGKSLLEGVAEGDFFYFLHSYYVVPSKAELSWARTEYGTTFTSVAGDGDGAVAGIQFHPEKSQELGLRVLGNYVASTSTSVSPS